MIPRERVLWYMEQYLRGDADQTDLRASPLRAIEPRGPAAGARSSPPASIRCATRACAYGDRLRAAGVDVVYREYPGQIHAFVSLTKAIPQGLTCTLEIGDYLTQHLGPAGGQVSQSNIRPR